MLISALNDYYSKSENSDVVPYVSVGSYKVKVSGKGNYEGSVYVDLKIFNTSSLITIIESSLSPSSIIF